MRGKAGTEYVSFPLDLFERAILSRLQEINPHDILNGENGPDETMVLSGELSNVETSIALIVKEMDEHGESPTLFQRLRRLEERQKQLSEKLNEARQKAAHPLSESWGETQSLLTALDNAPDPTEVRLRLRSALRRIVDSIRLLVVTRNHDRLAVAQVWFTGGEKCRTYFIIHRPPRQHGRTHHEGGWWVDSLDAVKGGSCRIFTEEPTGQLLDDDGTPIGQVHSEVPDLRNPDGFRWADHLLLNMELPKEGWRPLP
jgi:hypothetical protein